MCCFNSTATTEFYTYLHTPSLIDALPISKIHCKDSNRLGLLDWRFLKLPDPFSFLFGNQAFQHCPEPGDRALTGAVIGFGHPCSQLFEQFTLQRRAGGA